MKKIRQILIFVSVILLFADIGAGAYSISYCRKQGLLTKDEETEAETEKAKARERETLAAADTEQQTSEKKSNTKLQQLMAAYENGQKDYAQAKQECNNMGTDDLEDGEAEELLQFEETIKNDLKSQMADLAKQNNYEILLGQLNTLESELSGDELLKNMRSTYEPDYLRQLDTKREEMISNEQGDEAVAMLEAADVYVANDKNRLNAMLEDTTQRSKADDYVIPDSNTRYLTKEDIAGMTIKEINYAKNEITARNGRKFKSKELQDYFNSKDWYRGTMEPEVFDKKFKLNSFETYNITLLKDMELAMDPNGYQLDQN